MLRGITNWLSDDEIKSIYTSAYWNDEEEEKIKELWIGDGNYEMTLDYLESTKLLDEFHASEEFITDFPGEGLIVADLAAGIGWTSVLLSKLSKVSEVHAVEISKHRLGVLFEHALKMLSGKGEKLYRYLGSFYDLKFDDASIDIVYLSQAFHHADKPLRLLLECDRVLKNNGRIILVGEHHIGFKGIVRRFLANLIKRGKVTTNFYEMFPPDPVLGDHYYRCSDYYFMFGALGYNVKHKLFENGNYIFVADKAA